MLIRSSCMLIRGSRMLIGGGCAFLCRTNAGLGFLIVLIDEVASVFDLLPVWSPLLPYLFHLRLNRRGGIANVFFRCTTAGKQGARNDTSGRKKSFHKLAKTSASCIAIEK